MITNLSALRLRKAALQQDMRNSEGKMRSLWNDVLHKDETQNPLAAMSPTKRIISFVSTSGVVIDGAILGWKLYNRFGNKNAKKSKKKSSIWPF